MFDFGRDFEITQWLMETRIYGKGESVWRWGSDLEIHRTKIKIKSNQINRHDDDDDDGSLSVLIEREREEIGLIA